MDWINLADVSDRWRELVIGVMNFEGAIQCGELFGQMRTSQLLRKDLVPWS
jgi:hypothetical protein